MTLRPNLVDNNEVVTLGDFNINNTICLKYSTRYDPGGFATEAFAIMHDLAPQHYRQCFNSNARAIYTVLGRILVTVS